MQGLDRLFRKAMELRHPLTVHFDLTYRCPQRCLHCYLPEAWRRGEGPGPELDTGQVKAILDQLAAAGTFFLTFSGGEIFLRPDLFDLIAYARNLNFAISLMTSGSRGPEREQVRVLADLGVEAILVSLHSLEGKHHDQITGIPGSWQRTWECLQECRGRGLLVVINAQALRLNYLDLPALKAFAAEEGFPLRVDDNLSPRWDGKPHPKGLALNSRERQRFLEEMGLAGQEQRAMLTVPQEVSEGRCRAGLTLSYINPQGEVWPCVELPWRCGRLTPNVTFSQIWQESEVLRRLRELLHQDQKVHEGFCVYLRQNHIRPDAYPS